MSSQRQKALLLRSKQGAFVVEERDVPRPGKGQLLIKVYAAALNPLELKIQQAGIFIEDYPAVLGIDRAGIVEDVGEGVQNFTKGDRVFSQGDLTSDQAGFQQYALVASDLGTAKIPPNLSFDQAATVPMGFDTAAVGLYSEELGAGLVPPWVEGGQGKYAGKPILIMGGSASVGMYAIQLARLSGFSPIITTASLANQGELEALGATDVIDRHLAGAGFTVALQKITEQPFETVYDVIAVRATQEKAWSVVAHGGTLVLTSQPLVTEEEGKGRSVIMTYGNPHVQPNQTLCRGAWSILGEWLEDGVIKPNKLEVLPNGLGGINDGLERMKAGKVSGTKLVAHPQETA